MRDDHSPLLQAAIARLLAIKFATFVCGTRCRSRISPLCLLNASQFQSVPSNGTGGIRTPVLFVFLLWINNIGFIYAGLTGFEPVTYPLTADRTAVVLQTKILPRGLEPRLTALKGRGFSQLIYGSVCPVSRALFTCGYGDREDLECHDGHHESLQRTICRVRCHPVLGMYDQDPSPVLEPSCKT